MGIGAIRQGFVLAVEQPDIHQHARILGQILPEFLHELGPQRFRHTPFVRRLADDGIALAEPLADPVLVVGRGPAKHQPDGNVRQQRQEAALDFPHSLAPVAGENVVFPVQQQVGIAALPVE